MLPAALTTPEKDEGDSLFFGVDMRDPRTLRTGLLNEAENLRLEDGIPETRKGVTKPGWCNRVDASASMMISPWGTIYGGGVFRDPSSVNWLLLAADGYIWRCRTHNQPVSVPLPTAVQIIGACTFAQAFDKVYCFRGRHLAPLRMETFDDGFEDLLPHWNSTDTYAANTEVAYGPYQAVTSITRVGDVATVTTTDTHGYLTGADVEITGAVETAYNGRVPITVVDEFTFTYPVAGVPATPASGTILVSNMIQYWKARGTLWTVTITSSSTTATVTKVAHGFTTGQTVVIAGAVQTEYNGTYVITVTGADTFTYTFAGSGTTPATGTITARNTLVIANHSPDSAANDWTRVYNILPNADNALYVNNRLLVPTAYEPSSSDNYATFTSGTYRKKDYIVATDYLDDIHFDFSNEFRINQGSADEIVDLLKFNEDTVLVFKGGSWGVLSNVAFDLANLKLDMRSTEYGLSAQGACVLAGADGLFFSNKRGAVSVRQSENGKLISVDVPLSRPIQKLIDRIKWPLSSGIRMASWDSKLYVAVPLDDAKCVDTRILNLSQSIFFAGSVWQWVEANNAYMRIGAESYQIQEGTQANELGYWILKQAGVSRAYSLTGDLTGAWGVYAPWNPRPDFPAANIPIVNYAAVEETNNAILVHDFVAAQNGPNAGWLGRDTGSAICPKEFFKMPVDGVERLLFAGNDGYVNLMEASDAGDQVLDLRVDSGLQFTPITLRALTRAYFAETKGHLRPVSNAVVLQTLNPRYSVSVHCAGVNRKTSVATDRSRSRTRYFRPWDATPWDDTNVNDDHDTPNREDYSVTVPDDGLALGSGINLSRFQETIETFRITGRQSRSFQVEITNTRGRVKLLAMGLGAVPGRERTGTLV